MRILFVLETAGAGAGRHVLDLASGLLRRGNSVDLVYAAGRSEHWFEQGVRSLDGLRATRVPMPRGPHPADALAWWRLRRHLEENHCDIVHGHRAKGGALARLVGHARAPVVVYTPHAFPTLDPTLSASRRRLGAWIERWLAGRTDGIICVSSSEREHALELGIPEHLLFEVPNRLAALPPPQREAARAQMGLAPEHVCVGFVGRIAPQKGVKRLVRAFAPTAQTQPNARLALVGTGSEERAVRELVARHGIEGSVIFVGQADGPTMMAGFDVFALPSRYEAFPYVLLEAAERGLPIVTTLVGGAREIVTDGVNGYVVPQEAMSEFARRIRELCANAELRARMGAASKAALGAGVDEMVEQTIEVYETLWRKSRR